MSPHFQAKMDRLRLGDPVAYPKDLGPLYVSATFYTRNLERLDFLESVLMGKRRIAEWDFVPEQRREDKAEHSQQTMLT
jgi:hypothetical protein